MRILEKAYSVGPCSIKYNCGLHFKLQHTLTLIMVPFLLAVNEGELKFLLLGVFSKVIIYSKSQVFTKERSPCKIQ
jgi:hypothetical protein